MKIIPSPKSIAEKGNVTSLGSTLRILIDEKFVNAKNRLESIFLEAKINFSFVTEESNANIKIITDSLLDSEAYTIDCDEDSIILKSNCQNGALYAVETFRQLANLDFYTECDDVSFDSVKILDAPVKPYRGLMLDVARHFFTVKEVCSLLDHMARMKLNVFHFHLSDDQGFRFPSKKHPKITEIGQTRYGTEVRNNGRVVKEGTYTHSYTIEDLDKIVSYADSLGIEVIPEIDLPGHMVAVISAYNELSCEGNPIDVSKNWGILDTILCAGNPKMYEVICDILDEVCEVFPSKYIHLGGDEAPKKKWKSCPKCQSLMKEKGLKDEEDLQGYVFNYFTKYLSSKNKTVIGWNDCLNDELDAKVICEHWTPEYLPEACANTIKHVNSGRKVIMTGAPYYFDHPFGKISLEDTYNYSITFKDFTEDGCKNILGTECCVWTEWMPELQKLQFNVFPRLAVYSECAWVENKLSYSDFRKKLQKYYKVYEKLGVYYARGMDSVDSEDYNSRVHTTNDYFEQEFYREVNQQLQKDGKELLPKGIETPEI